MAKNLSSAGQRRGYQSSVKYLDRWPFADSLKRGYATPTGLLPYADTATGDATFTTSAGAATAAGGSSAFTGNAIYLVESTETLWTTATTAYNVTAPATLTEGDLLWVQFANADTAGSFTTVPSGWTAEVPVLNASGGNMITAYWHVVTAGEEASPPATFDFVWSSSLTGNALLAVFRNVDSTTPIDVGYASVTNGTTTKTVPSITTVTDYAMVIGGAQLQSATTQTVNAPAGWVEIENSSTQSAGRGAVLAYEGLQATAGATGTNDFTQTSALQGYAYQVALRPAGVSGDATFTTSAGSALGGGGSSTFTGTATFTTNVGAATANGGSSAFTAGAAFTTNAGAATANGGSSAFAGGASFATAAGSALANGGSTTFTGDATFGTAAGAATAQGGTSTFTGGAGGAGTFTTTAGAALASGGSTAFTGGAGFTTTAAAALAGGGSSTFAGGGSFTTAAAAALAGGGSSAFTGSAAFTTAAASALANGGSSTFTGGATFGSLVGSAVAGGGTGSFVGVTTAAPSGRARSGAGGPTARGGSGAAPRARTGGSGPHSGGNSTTGPRARTGPNGPHAGGAS